MKWFQHDSNASTDAKIRRLILRHGAEGYAIYMHCLELIAGNITIDNITFELEHDAEIIADNLKIKGNSNESGIDKVNRIMKTIINEGLFSINNNKIFCFKLAQRLDNTVSRSPLINSIKAKLKLENEGSTKLLRSKNVSEENRIDKITIDKNKKDKKKKEVKHKYGEYKNVLLTDNEVLKLKDKFDVLYTDKIKQLDEGIELKGYVYKSHYLAILKWSEKDEKNRNTGNFKRAGKETRESEKPAKLSNTSTEISIG